MKNLSKEKRTNLLRQVGTLIILLFGVELIIDSIGIMTNQIRISINHDNDFSTNLAMDVADRMQEYSSYEWVLDQIEKNGYDIMDYDAVFSDTSGYDEEELMDELNYIFEHKKEITAEEAEAFTPAGKLQLCNSLFVDVLDTTVRNENLVEGLNISICRKTDKDSLFYFVKPIDIDYARFSDDVDYMLETEMKAIGEEPYKSHDNGNYYNWILHEYWFGDSVKKLPAMTYEVKFKGNKKGTPMTVSSYCPVISEDGEIVAIITAERAWSVADILYMLSSALRMEVSNAIYLALCAAALLYLLNRVAVDPLSKLQHSVQDYKEDKDTERIVDNLNNIHSRNEIGRLSTDVSELSIELDRYSADLMLVTAEKERISAELDVAAAIQTGILAKVDSTNPVYEGRKGYDIYASMTPAKEVGGDLYDFFLVDDDHLALIIGDVSGKGIPAALFMAITTVLFRHEIQSKTMSLPEVMNSVNNRLCEGNENMMFVTLWAGILELSTGNLVCVNGGHDYPMIRHGNGEFQEIREITNLALGVFPGEVYEQHEYVLNPGDTIMLFTDGIPEATDSDENLFGIDRTLSALNESPDRSPKELIEAILSSISDFVDCADQFDDMTMLCVKIEGGE